MNGEDRPIPDLWKRIIADGVKAQIKETKGGTGFYFNPKDLFVTVNGRKSLKMEIFERALTHIKPDSSPGYPFEEAQNAHVDPSRLYELVNKMMLYLCSDTPMPKTTEEKLEAMLNGHLFPNTAFTKGEPTDTNKIARNIYGDSLVMNVIARILFGGFLMTLGETYEWSVHKVGFDFVSEAGIRRFFNSCKSTFRGSHIYSDDIQGWEYMQRWWFLHLFCMSYAEVSLDNHPFCPDPEDIVDWFNLYERFAQVYDHKLVIDSDGYVHELPFFILFSGIVLTHILNSVSRGALAKLDRVHVEGLLHTARSYLTIYASVVAPREMTNGDDCAFSPSNLEYPDIGLWPTSQLGFVHTDVQVSRNEEGAELEFSSQRIVLGESSIYIEPSSLHKTFYNACRAITLENQVSYDGVMSYLARSPHFSVIQAACEKLRRGKAKSSAPELKRVHLEEEPSFD